MWTVSGRVLIVPLWNWNNGIVMDAEYFKSFNRTFMELKFGKIETSTE